MLVNSAVTESVVVSFGGTEVIVSGGVASDTRVSRPVSAPSAIAATPHNTSAPSARRIHSPAPSDCFIAANTFPPTSNASASDTAAPNADQHNEMVGIFSGNHSGDTNYVAECRSARELRHTWTIPMAIVGGGLQLGAIASSVVIAYRKSLPT